MNDTIITKDELKRLIRDEGIRPEDIFTADQLKPTLDAARAAGYADARAADVLDMSRGAAPKKTDDGEAEADDPAKYTDPARNPFIKTD